MTGGTLNSVELIPPAILDHLGRQLDCVPPRIASLRAFYRRRRRTGSVSTCASWRIPVVVGYAAARFSLVRGMKRDAVPGMSIHGRQASV
jgi:hypothetical protein